MSSPSTPFPWKGDARRAGVGRRRKRAKPTSGATRHLLPEEGGRSGMSNPSPSKGRGWKKCNNAHRQEAPRSIDDGNVTFGHRLIYTRGEAATTSLKAGMSG